MGLMRKYRWNRSAEPALTKCCKEDLKGSTCTVAQATTMGVEVPQSQPADDPVMVPDTDPLDNPRLSPSMSVTENTTRSLEPTPKEYAAKE